MLAVRVENPPPPPEAVPAIRTEKSAAVQQREAPRSPECEVQGAAVHIMPEAGASIPDVWEYLNSELKQRTFFLSGYLGIGIKPGKLEADQRGVQFKDLSEVGVNGVQMKLKGYIDLLVFSVPVMAKTSTRSTLWRVSDICELWARFLGSSLHLTRGVVLNKFAGEELAEMSSARRSRSFSLQDKPADEISRRRTLWRMAEERLRRG